MEAEQDDDRERPTVTMHRDALLGLLDQSAAEPAPLAHTVPREQLRARAVTRNDSVEPPPGLFDPTNEPIDTDIRPSLSPLLVFGVIMVLLVAFLAASHLR